MSTSSARRAKERSAGPGKIAASTDKITPVSVKSVSTGKENPRATSRIRATTQKPNILPMARIDKSATAAVEESRLDSRVRRSTSSVPRGRSSSPSEFTRALSDLRKDSRVSMGHPQIKVNSSFSNAKTSGRCNIQKKVPKDMERNGRFLDELERNSQENKKSEATVVKNSGPKKTTGYSSSISVKYADLEKRVSTNLKRSVKSSDELDGSCLENSGTTGVKSCSNEKKGRTLSSVSMSRSDHAYLNEKSSSDDGTKVKASVERKLRSSGGFEVESTLRESKMVKNVSTSGGNKYPSKLHEKLAFLEGKVKRIASDIKRTKEMLDNNNPDASKIILCDIQEKISGIENAMVHVVGNEGNAKMGLVKCENGDKEEEMDAIDAKSLTKGLNVEDLEARLFPHHKLIRDRTLSKISCEESNTLDMEEDKVISVDANPIALEFLASLSNMETKVGSDANNVQEVDDAVTSATVCSSLNVLNGKGKLEALLLADENLNEFDDQEMVPAMMFEEEDEESFKYQLNDIGGKSSTGGWFVSEGESVLLAHANGSCSFYDIADCEEKAEYKPPAQVSPNMWRDCWIIRAPSADGCSGKYVIAASAGNSVNSGFCSWDFYTKDIRAVHFEEEAPHVRTALAPLSNNTMYRTNPQLPYMAPENRQWWYKPCGPLVVSTATCQKTVQIYDIRDGEQVMKWELQKPVLGTDHASPLYWRNRGKVVIAELDAISLWDVSSLTSQALLSVSSSGQRISALHVNNTDAEPGGGFRQRVSSSEAEGNDGVFCTPDSINVLDFRLPSGIGLKIPKPGLNAQSSFSCGDNIYIGSTSLSSAGKRQSSSQIHQLSLRQQRLLTTYAMPESNAHHHFTALTQVWGNSSLVMGVSGLGLFVFDSVKEDGFGSTENVKEIMGPDDMYSPSFDYSGSRVLLISRDRPACWRYLL